MALFFSSILFTSCGLVLYFLDKRVLITWLKRMACICLVSLLGGLFLGLTLKACNAEYENQLAKQAQWQYERENNLPYTSFSGE